MLFAVSGSQGSGKSTLIEGLCRNGYNVIERKTSRSILEDWGVSLSEVNNDRELTVKFQMEILKRKLHDESHALTCDEPWITERSYMDLFTYALVAIGKDNEYSDWLNRYYESCRTAQRSYRKIFYISGGKFEVQADGVRAINQHYADMVDNRIEHYLKLCNENFQLTLIDKVNLDERIKIVDDNIQYVIDKIRFANEELHGESNERSEN